MTISRSATRSHELGQRSMGAMTDDPLSLTPDEQRLANVITVVNPDTLPGIARNLNDRGKKSQRRTQW